MRERIYLRMGDLSSITADVLINPINTELTLSKEGFEGQILKLGGENVQKELNEIGKVALGDAVVTAPGNIGVGFVVHSVCQSRVEVITEEMMTNAMRSAFAIAKERGVKTVLIPATAIVSKGEFPVKRSAELMVSEAIKHLESDTTVEEIFFIIGNNRTFDLYEECLRQT
ncbi:MAG: macro domain-containing protein [Planctomycetes bacterium]|nr:macro domain-containing protein [Planctomycetota bacterium]